MGPRPTNRREGPLLFGGHRGEHAMRSAEFMATRNIGWYYKGGRGKGPFGAVGMRVSVGENVRRRSTWEGCFEASRRTLRRNRNNTSC